MLTDEERQKRKPIYGTDLSKPASELLQGWRDDMTKMRRHCRHALLHPIDA